MLIRDDYVSGLCNAYVRVAGTEFSAGVAGELFLDEELYSLVESHAGAVGDVPAEQDQGLPDLDLGVEEADDDHDQPRGVEEGVSAEGPPRQTQLNTTGSEAGRGRGC